MSECGNHLKSSIFKKYIFLFPSLWCICWPYSCCVNMDSFCPKKANRELLLYRKCFSSIKLIKLTEHFLDYWFSWALDGKDWSSVSWNQFSAALIVAGLTTVFISSVFKLRKRQKSMTETMGKRREEMGLNQKLPPVLTQEAFCNLSVKRTISCYLLSSSHKMALSQNGWCYLNMEREIGEIKLP